MAHQVAEYFLQVIILYKSYSMKGLVIGVVSIVAVSWLVTVLMQKNALQKRQTEVADAGYETAYDILYPLR